MREENVTLGYAKRPELTEGNLERNQALEVKKGDILKITKYNDATVNGIHAYDEVITYEVLGIRKSKNGRRVKVKNLEFGYTPTFLIDESHSKIEIVNQVEIEVESVSEVEQIKTESQQVMNSINTETLETKKESLEVVSDQLDKINEAIEKNIDNEEIRLKLRDIENNLKYNYNGLYEMIEEQTCPDANDFNNIETLKTVYITNWKELPQEIQQYILSCDKYWIGLQWIDLYKDNKRIASIGISGHHKHDIEINSIGAGNNGELFHWNLYKGFIINNLTQELTSNKELNKIINTYTDTKEIEAIRTLYRGSISKEVLYNIYQNSIGYKDLYIEYYQMIICNDKLKVILTYCEGDFIAEVYNSESTYNKGIEITKNFIEEM